ncbi:Peptidyl-prolyl cis-trans isomerase [Hondaea fermentalgiana]|uniref:peptidylprolyl isomerase n=1 Tax=Hondaea fermentalgiana TaxID=2315210 RepID=A0A2R5H0Y4_9STRA|nr:Peptidyl-prolyl cis-trans isomerase [Hondaea fermentalgiana]|eukprot:GBG33984.1 Peptidyl-prolyl cis-trans isomerase [Hondaea fermentalgiana]
MALLGVRRLVQPSISGRVLGATMGRMPSMTSTARSTVVARSAAMPAMAQVQRRLLSGDSSDGSKKLVADVEMRVKMDYTLRLAGADEVLDSSEKHGPMSFILGRQEVIPGIEDEVRGMEAGEERTEVLIAPELAYGEKDDRKVAKVPLDRLPEDVEAGMRLQMSTGQQVRVQEILKEEELAVLDLNHPLAGETLRFDIRVVDVERLPPVRVDVSKPGTGSTKPELGDSVTMHYTGRIDGSEEPFDSSRNRGEPLTFSAGHRQLIIGLDNAIMSMTTGEQATVHLPSVHAYGERGAGNGVIPPNADLVFEVEILSIEPAGKEPSPEDA